MLLGGNEELNGKTGSSRVSNGVADSPIDARDATGSPERFGYSWERFSLLTDAQEDQFRLWTAVISEQAWKGATFLDVGCGAGRNSYWAMKRGAVSGVSIDIDIRSLQRACTNLKEYPAVKVRNQSVYDIEEENQFDIVFSIGVIHHLLDPEGAVRRMTQAAKPGGLVLVWVYGYENNEWILRYVNPFREHLLSKLPLPFVYWLSLFPAMILWSALRLPLRKGRYFKLLRTFTFGHVRHIVFDHMIPSVARYYRRDEAIDLIKQAGLVLESTEWVNCNSWAVLGKKAASS